MAVAISVKPMGVSALAQLSAQGTVAAENVLLVNAVWNHALGIVQGTNKLAMQHLEETIARQAHLPFRALRCRTSQSWHFSEEKSINCLSSWTSASRW